MSIGNISGAGAIISLLNLVGKSLPSASGSAPSGIGKSATGIAAASGTDNLLSSLALRGAGIRSPSFESFDSLLNSLSAGGKDKSSGLDFLFAGQNASSSPLATPFILPATANMQAQASGLSPQGRNLALFDPESAYAMMSRINGNDVNFKAQFAEMSQMQSYLAGMQTAGKELGGIDPASGNDAIRAQLEEFVGRYNDWVQRFDEDMQKNGMLAETQAAQVSRYELEQSIKDSLRGANHGLRGLGELGLQIDPASRLATLDPARLETLLAGNKQGGVATLQEFGKHFARSAELLNSDNNFIRNQLARLDNVIDYFADHKSALQAEFGLGDAPRPDGLVARALAAYQQASETQPAAATRALA